MYATANMNHVEDETEMLAPLMQSPGQRRLAYTAVFLLALGLRLGYEASVWQGFLENADSPACEDLATTIVRMHPYHTSQSVGPGESPSNLQRTPG
jgi:hypothetical protein